MWWGWLGGWVGMGLWNAVGCEECTPLPFVCGGKVGVVSGKRGEGGVFSGRGGEGVV